MAAVAASLLSLVPVAGQADTYVPDVAAQDFAGGPGGWAATSTAEGACIPVLLCPTATNDWAAGGADGNGYIRTQFSTVAATVAGTTAGTWESPAFTYTGAGGQVPAAVTLDLNTRRDLGELLGLSVLNESSFQVDLVDQATGTKIGVVPATPLIASTSWTAIPTVSVNPALLRLGRAYRIQITTTYHAAVTAVVSGEVGYDNVRLTTAAGTPAGPVGPNGGSGITTVKQLRQFTKDYILPGSAKLVRGRLVMKLRCPAVASPKPCQVQLQGLSKGRFSKPATARKIVKINAGKTRLVKIRVKRPYVATYEAARKVWVKSIVRVGKVRVTVRKRVKLH